MARHLALVAALGLALTGCVSQEKYNALKMEKDAAVEQLNAAQAAEREARAQADAWKQQLDRLVAASGESGNLMKTLSDENALLKAQLASMEEKYKNLADRPVSVVSLPPALNDALKRFAAANPDLVEYDEARGIVKFKSDVTFAKGSAELTPAAKTAIQNFAKILNSADARDYEFFVAGHTDNTPVKNPATIQAGHKDNWFLSSHRAIAVGHELMTGGISPRRVGAVGYADQRPVASNATAAGQARNRRVEVVLLPTTIKSSTPVEAAPAPKAPKADLNKDTPVAAPKKKGPELNK